MNPDEWSNLKSDVIKPYCDRAIGPPFNPEDRASEILTTVYLRSKGLSPRELGKLWLKSTISGEAKKTYRKRKCQPEPLESEPPDSADSVLDQVCHLEQINALRSFLPELSEKQRQSLYTMFPTEGFQPSESEVAIRFGVSESRVRQIRGEAVALLRKKFSVCGLGET